MVGAMIADDDLDDVLERLDMRSERTIQRDLVRALRSALDDCHAARRHESMGALARVLEREADELARMNQTSIPFEVAGGWTRTTAADGMRAGRARALAHVAAREARAAAKAARERRREQHAAMQPSFWGL
jgi:hypothetical protein